MNKLYIYLLRVGENLLETKMYLVMWLQRVLEIQAFNSSHPSAISFSATEVPMLIIRETCVADQ
jgi:hypothetical protein